MGKRWEETKAFLKSWFRMGAKETSQMLVAFPNQSVQPIEEPGMPGNPTAHEVYEDKHPEQSFERHLDAQSKSVGKDVGRSRSRKMDMG